jgi:geranylgeranyl pyrophosphate synthase
MLSRNGSLPSIEAYYDRIYAKTASLFALCAESGPVLGQLGAEEVSEARRFGRLLGEAFQIVDDVLDIVGSSHHLGKPAGTDLRQGLVTLPVIVYAETHADDERLASVLKPQATEATVQALVEAILATKSDEVAMQRAEAHVATALSILDRFPDSPDRGALEEIARFAVRRRH